MRTLRFAAFMVVFLGTTLCAKADPVIFGLDQSGSEASFGPGAGVGQAVIASDDVYINDFGFYLDAIPAGTVDYFIYDKTTSSLILGPDGVSAPAKGWDYLTGLDIELIAGDTYYFGVYDTAGTLYVGEDPTSSVFTDGLGISGGVSSVDFNGTTPTGIAGASDVALRIESADPSNAPEPSSLMLLGTGILAGAGVLRRKFAR